jgi:hypothetical protein
MLTFEIGFVTRVDHSTGRMEKKKPVDRQDHEEVRVEVEGRDTF